MCRKLETYLPNIVATIVGIGIIVWAIVTVEYLQLVNEILPSNYNSASIILFTAGLLILALPIIDCASNRYVENKTYRNLCVNAFLLMCSILLFSSGVMACVLITDLSYESSVQLAVDLERYNTYGFRDFTEAVDRMQSMMHCCGSYNYTDWATTTWTQEHPSTLPKSCCSSELTVCAKNYTNDKNDIYTVGCYGPLTWHVRNVLESVGFTGFGFWIFVTYLRACMYVAKKSNHRVVPSLSTDLISSEDMSFVDTNSPEILKSPRNSFSNSDSNVVFSTENLTRLSFSSQKKAKDLNYENSVSVI